MLVELKARFDEENNIVWAKMLEKAGCHVIYGLVGLKTHSKITLVVRREEDGIRRYVHLGTGNYNDSTAKLYTDCGLLTCCHSHRGGRHGRLQHAVRLFGARCPGTSWRWRRSGCGIGSWQLIRAERRSMRRNGQPARIIAKMNSLCDREIIAALYEASRGRGKDRPDRPRASAV